MLARNLLNCFVFTCCLMAGSMVAANTEEQQTPPENTADPVSIKTGPDIVELKCTSRNGIKATWSEVTLLFDKANKKVKYGSWSWFDTLLWDEDGIIWATARYSEDINKKPHGFLFMFHRKKSMLQIKTMVYELDFPEYNNYDGGRKASICVLEF